jgi:hypothetical protein
MNPSQKPSDPLLQSLASEASELPVRAALAARQRSSQRRVHQRGFAVVAIMLLAGAGVWLLFPGDTAETPVVVSNAIPAIAPSPAPPGPTMREFVHVQTEEEARLHPPPMPEGLDREQQALIAAAPDLPLLIVRDNGGSTVTRIHVIERE